MVCHCALNSLCRPAAWKVKYGAGPSGYTWVQRQVTSPGRPVASTMERSVAAFTLSWNDSNRSQVIAVSNVSLMMPRWTVRSRAKGSE